MILHRRALLAGVSAVLTVRGAAAQSTAAGITSPDALLDAAFASAGPPALIAGAVTREGLVWSGVRGLRRAGGDQAATLEDRWHLGSNTKAMTAALYARLVEKGQARWGASMAELFPDVSVDPAWREATIEALLDHTSGLTDAGVIGAPWLLTARADPRSLEEQRSMLARQALGAAPAGAAGTFAYSNAGYILAGAAIERITGQAWEEAMRAEVFAPLGLASAGFGPPTGDQPWGHRSVGGVPRPMDPADPGADNPLALGPAGTVHMSLADYATFVRAFLTEGAGWLKPESVARLTTPRRPDARYALGWIVMASRPWATGPVIAHEGSNTMWHSMVVADPKGGRAWIALSNDEAKGAPACQALVPSLIRADTA